MYGSQHVVPTSSNSYIYLLPASWLSFLLFLIQLLLFPIQQALRWLAYFLSHDGISPFMYTCIRVVAQTLECMEGWNMLNMKSRLSLDSIDFCLYWRRSWLRSAYTFNTIINIDCILCFSTAAKGCNQNCSPPLHSSRPYLNHTMFLATMVDQFNNNIYYRGAGCLMLCWAYGIFRKYLSPGFFSLELRVLQF